MGVHKKRSIKIVLAVIFCVCVCCFVQPVKKCIVDALPSSPTHEEVLKSAYHENLVRTLNAEWENEEVAILDSLGNRGIADVTVKKLSVDIVDFEAMPLGIILAEIQTGPRLELKYFIFKYTAEGKWKKVTISDEIGEIQ